MGSRMDKYNNNNDLIPTRSDRNKKLYTQVYNAYDEFENLVVPSNAKEISPHDLKREITSRDEYRKAREYGDITNNKIVKKEKEIVKKREETEIYDIKELLNKAVNEKKEDEEVVSTLSNGDYLKKLKLDNSRTNIEQVKEIYEVIKEEVHDEEDESLLKTANLSLEILSDLKSDNDETKVNAPIKEEEMPLNIRREEEKFYSNTYKFSKKDFEDKKYEENIDTDDEFDDISGGSGKFFFKILLLIFGLILIVLVSLYLISYFNRV